MPTKKKVGVIGAGIIGIAAASFLQRDGHEVFILDPGNPGEGASFGNAGCFNGSSIVPMSTPGIIKKAPGWLLDPLGPLSIRWSYLPKAAPWLWRFVRAGRPTEIEHQARALRSILSHSPEQLAPLLKAAGAEDLIQRLGTMIAYRSEEAFRAARETDDLRRTNGIEMEILDTDQLRQFEPTIAQEYVKGVLIRENGHTTNPLRLVQRLADSFLRQGGIIRKARAIGFALDGNQLRAIHTDRGAFEADSAVVAAGAYSSPMATELGDHVSLESQRGYHIMIHDPEVSPRIPITDAAGKFAVCPMETGLRFAGTVEFAGLNAPPDWRRARILLEQGRRLLPGLAAQYAEDRLSLWMGHRPSTPDSLPVIGPAHRSADVIYAFGHGHTGLAAAGTTGKIVADLVSGRPSSIDLTPFRARRF